MMIARSALIFLIILSGNNFVAANTHVNELDINESFRAALELLDADQYVEAANVFELLAEQGLPEAQYNLSVLLFNGLGAPKNFKDSLKWSWKAHLNDHSKAKAQTEKILDSITSELQDVVAVELIDELSTDAEDGDIDAALKIGKTYTDLLVEPDFGNAYIWLSIAQAHGYADAGPLLDRVSDELTIEVIIERQDEARILFERLTKQ